MGKFVYFVFLGSHKAFATELETNTCLFRILFLVKAGISVNQQLHQVFLYMIKYKVYAKICLMQIPAWGMNRSLQVLKMFQLWWKIDLILCCKSLSERSQRISLLLTLLTIRNGGHYFHSLRASCRCMIQLHFIQKWNHKKKKY